MISVQRVTCSSSSLVRRRHRTCRPEAGRKTTEKNFRGMLLSTCVPCQVVRKVRDGAFHVIVNFSKETRKRSM